MLDPIADKAFIVTALAAFALGAEISPAAFLVLLARDLFVTAGFLLVMALRLPVRLHARFPGKLVTSLQIAAVLVLTLLPAASGAVIVATLIASAWAIADYATAALRDLRQQRDRRLRTPDPGH
jgi:phosphatidylglycerophosphate synthase